MHRSLVRAAIAAALLIAPSLAAAQPLYVPLGSTFAYAVSEGGGRYVASPGGAYVSADTSYDNPWYGRQTHAFAYAGLRLGRLGVEADATGPLAQAWGYAGFADAVLFENPSDLGTIESFSVSIDGYAQGIHGSAGAKAQIIVDNEEDPAFQSTWKVLHGNDTFDFEFMCPAHSLFNVNPCVHTFQIELWALAWAYDQPWSAEADYSHTLQVSVHPAAGNSWTSWSGQLLADAPTTPPTTETPEPATLALLGGGLLGLAATARARRGTRRSIDGRPTVDAHGAVGQTPRCPSFVPA